MLKSNSSRRQFLTTAAATLVAGSALVAGISTASAATIQEFNQEAFQEAIASGKPVVVRFYETWCPQCTRQGRIVNDLVSNDEAFDDFTIFEAVYSDHRQFAAQVGIRRRTSMVLIKDSTVIDGVVGETRENALREFLSGAL